MNIHPPVVETELKNWREEEKKALKLLRLSGNLRFDKAIELIIFREDIYDSRPSSILDMHKMAKNYVSHDVDIDDTLDIATIIDNIQNLAPSRIDIGKLAADWRDNQQDFDSLEAFVGHRLSGFVGEGKGKFQSRDVVLYGFGRIGRLLARRIIESTGKGAQLRLRAIVVRQKMKDAKDEIEKRMSLLKSDSVHGDFPGRVTLAQDGKSVVVNGNKIDIIFANSPKDVDYTQYGIENAIVIDNTGVWRNREDLSQHLRPGASKVILTAPGTDVPNIVYGVNHDQISLESDNVLSAASCTTNAIVPIIKVIDELYGIDKGHIETIHAYTSDQNLLDNFHKKPRRGRAAAINMVLTSTGAAKAVSKVIPHLSGKLTGNAVRVPTPNVSLAIMNLTVDKPTDLESLNAALRKASLEGELVEQIHYSESTEYVSSHAIGMNSTSVLDAPSTIVSADGKNITVYAWYDNEHGYSCQVVRFAKHVAQVRRYVYY